MELNTFFWLEWVGCGPDPPLVSLGATVRVFCTHDQMFFHPSKSVMLIACDFSIFRVFRTTNRMFLEPLTNPSS
jgi:hypothetical protein